MFDWYQKSAAKTFKEHKELPADKAQLLDWAVGMSGETGEVNEIIKHHVFSEEPLDKMRLAKELGDVLWYLSAMAHSNGIALSSVAELNSAKLTHRYQKQKYTNEDSAKRHVAEHAFENTFQYKCIQSRILHTPAPLNIIFVGPDGSGKTTLATMLAQKLQDEEFTYHKCDYRQDDKPELAKMLLNNNINVIYDRFYYPDDIIYSKIKAMQSKDEESIDWNTDYWKAYNEVRNLMNDVNTVIFLVDADLDTLISRSGVWKDDYISTSDLPAIKDLYARWASYMCDGSLAFFKIDTTTGTLQEHMLHILMCVHRAQALYSGLPVDTFLTDREKELAERIDNEDN